MIEIIADREHVTIEHEGKTRCVLAANKDETPYQRPVRIRAEDEMGTVVITLRWSAVAGQVRVSLRRAGVLGELMSTDIQDGETPSGVVLKVYTGRGKYRVSRVKRT